MIDEKEILDLRDTIPGRYIRLALAIDRQINGFIDSYYGPEVWRREAEEDSSIPVKELISTAEALAAEIAGDRDLEVERKRFLNGEIGAIRMHLLRLAGEEVSLAEEAQALYDFTPFWYNESEFSAALKRLDGLLPAGGTRHERWQAWREETELHVDEDSPLTRAIVSELRSRTETLFGLPEGESFEIKYVNDVPWGAYNWYLGGFKSRIEINADSPITIMRLVGMVAHEGYAGHHTELATKELVLTRQKGWFEHCLHLLSSPSAIIAEGIAVRALEMLFTPEKLADWLQQEIYPMAGLDPAIVDRDVQIIKATRILSWTPCNAAMMLLERGADETEAIAYMREYAVGSAREVENMVGMIKQYRSYVYTYTIGGKLLDDLFDVKKQPVDWFKRLLREPVTPRQVQDWIVN